MSSTNCGLAWATWAARILSYAEKGERGRALCRPGPGRRSHAARAAHAARLGCRFRLPGRGPPEAPGRVFENGWRRNVKESGQMKRLLQRFRAWWDQQTSGEPLAEWHPLVAMVETQDEGAGQ